MRNSIIFSVTWDSIVLMSVYAYATSDSVLGLVVAYVMAAASMVLSNLNLVVFHKNKIEFAKHLSNLSKEEIAIRRACTVIDLSIAATMAMVGLVLMSGMYIYSVIVVHTATNEAKRLGASLKNQEGSSA